MQSLAAEAAARVGDFGPQGLANTAWAGHPSPLLFSAIAAEAERRLDLFEDQGLSTTAWAYAVV
jgi:hypothetical protein